MGFGIRRLVRADAADALALYSELTFGPKTLDAQAFERVLEHDGTTVFGAEVDGNIRAMVTLHLLPNVTWNARPYGLIENVITALPYRRTGLGRKVLSAAVTAAWEADAYKVMLMTGKKRGAAGFYEATGFSREDKDALVIRRPEPRP